MLHYTLNIPRQSTSQVHQYNRICMQAKSQFVKAKIQDKHNNPQKLWRILGDVLHRLPAKILPAIKPPQLLADRFVEFFTEKIEKIRSKFSASANLQHITPDSPPSMFSTFSTVTEDQVTKVINNFPGKSCSLDPWPTFLVLDYLDILIIPITSIINASLEQGKCPNFFKQAHVTPLLKKKIPRQRKLKLNPDKTKFILIGSRKNRNQLLPHFPINILGNQVSPAQSVRNLEVVFDSNFTFSNHVSQVIKSTRVQARDLYRICPLLDLNASVLLANVLVSSRLDYCNSLFLLLTDFELRRLQLVQNSL